MRKTSLVGIRDVFSPKPAPKGFETCFAPSQHQKGIRDVFCPKPAPKGFETCFAPSQHQRCREKF